jgi:hypothetical protein
MSVNPPVAPPDFLEKCHIYWPFDPWNPDTPGTGFEVYNVPATRVPTSRLSQHVGEGYVGLLQGGFIPPLCNWWIDIPADQGGNYSTAMTVLITAAAAPFTGNAFSWDMHVETASMIQFVGDIDWFTYVVVAGERRWGHTPGEFIRLYCVGLLQGLWEIPPPPTAKEKEDIALRRHRVNVLLSWQREQQAARWTVATKPPLPLYGQGGR